MKVSTVIQWKFNKIMAVTFNMAIVDKCLKNNTILKLSAESAEKGLNRFRVVFHFCRLRIDTAPVGRRKACVLAPTVPLVRQYFDEIQHQREGPGRINLRSRCIIGTPEVDSWSFGDWREVVEQNDPIIITPQLFLDALTVGHLEMSEFCALAFDECQHCIGSHGCHSHPFSRIVDSLVIRDSIRVLGLGTHLVKKKIKDSAEQQAAVNSLERVLHAKVVPC
jgi:ERCC4-related helicase